MVEGEEDDHSCRDQVIEVLFGLVYLCGTQSSLDQVARLNQLQFHLRLNLSSLEESFHVTLCSDKFYRQKTALRGQRRIKLGKNFALALGRKTSESGRSRRW